MGIGVFDKNGREICVGDKVKVVYRGYKKSDESNKQYRKQMTGVVEELNSGHFYGYYVVKRWKKDVKCYAAHMISEKMSKSLEVLEASK